ncbi:PREDICTED: tetraspanin-9-like [Priapulus caudatus]|uniref:Tetraspanin n=1 Tax=Priapulus caudatus TaxID=37621 RepID=A0ABM1EZM4_PRICU|nr:PREDICTED: tetraspanin-9-like [Priapulus caudatus]
MAIGCGAKCAKALLIIFNVIFWLSGATLLGIGIWLLVEPDNQHFLEILKVPSTDEMLKYAAYLLIAVGALVFVVGFFGCCGAIQESKCMLVTYFVCLIIILGCEIAAGILAVVYKDKIHMYLDDEVPDMLKNEYMKSEDQKGMTRAWDWVQQEQECCGFNSYKDYDGNTNLPRGYSFPLSCCKRQDNTEIDNVTPANEAKCKAMEENFFYKTPCKASINNWFDDHVIIVIGLGLGIGCLELFGMIFAICLCRNIGEEI